MTSMQATDVQPRRCPWATSAGPLMMEYHDTEWGIPCHDSTRLFELLSLESMQAGLSWSLVLNRRASLRKAFLGFEPHVVADLDSRVTDLLEFPGMIRNRRKIEAIIHNARIVSTLDTSFDDYVWSFCHGEPTINRPPDHDAVPVTTPLAQQMGQRMKADGFRFVGPLTTHSFMQAAGLINDHEIGCFLCPAKS